MKKIVLLFTVLLAVFLMGCSKDEETMSKTESSSSNSTTLKTEAIINVVDAQFNPESGYLVMMFLEKPETGLTLPEIEMQVTSNSEGVANFDLNDYIVTPTKLYFEAFLQEGNYYIWKGITHPEKTISKGTKWTTTIIVE